MNTYPKAIILAGGEGARLGALGQIMPKCLAQVYEQPLIVKQIEQCIRAGAREIIISVAAHFLAVLKAALSHYSPEQKTVIRCFPESEPLGAVRGLTSLAPLIENAPCLVMLGDEYFEDNKVFDIIGGGKLREDLVLGVIHDDNPSRMDCNVTVDATGALVSIKDKPSPEEVRGDLRWCGFLAFRSGFFQRAHDLVESGRLDEGHLGDFLDALKKSGISTGMVEFQKENININSANDMLLASLLEARNSWHRTNPDDLPILNRFIQEMLSIHADGSSEDLL